MKNKLTLPFVCSLLCSFVLISQEAQSDNHSLIQSYLKLEHQRFKCQEQLQHQPQGDCNDIHERLLVKADSLSEVLDLSYGSFKIWWRTGRLYSIHKQYEEAERSSSNALQILENISADDDSLGLKWYYHDELLSFLINNSLRQKNFEAADKFQGKYAQLPERSGCGTVKLFKPYWNNANYKEFIIAAGLEDYERAYHLVKNNSFPLDIKKSEFDEMWLQFYVKTIKQQYSRREIAAELKRCFSNIYLAPTLYDYQVKQYQSDFFNEDIPQERKFDARYIAYGETTFFGNTIFIILTEEVRKQQFFHEYCMGSGSKTFIQKAIKEEFMQSDFYLGLSSKD